MKTPQEILDEASNELYGHDFWEAVSSGAYALEDIALLAIENYHKQFKIIES